MGGASSPKIERTFNSVTQVSSDGMATAKAGMHVSRVHFGCALSQHDRRVVIVGGQIDALTATDRCELYDLRSDSWAETARLPKPLLSSSVVVVEHKYQYRINNVAGDKA